MKTNIYYKLKIKNKETKAIMAIVNVFWFYESSRHLFLNIKKQQKKL